MYRRVRLAFYRNYSGTTRFPPAVILKTVLPASERPVPLVTPLETVIWPPLCSVQIARRFPESRKNFE
jgi:hypothetical protein